MVPYENHNYSLTACQVQNWTLMETQEGKAITHTAKQCSTDLDDFLSNLRTVYALLVFEIWSCLLGTNSALNALAALDDLETEWKIYIGEEILCMPQIRLIESGSPAICVAKFEHCVIKLLLCLVIRAICFFFLSVGGQEEIWSAMIDGAWALLPFLFLFFSIAFASSDIIYLVYSFTHGCLACVVEW